MKTRLATALSVVGVLGAGSAAALVNTQILDSGPTEATASAAALKAGPVDLSIPESTEGSEAAPTTTSSSGLATTTTAAAPLAPSGRAQVEGGGAVSPAAAPASTSYLTTYNVGEAGSVTVDVIDGRLLLVKSEPMSGWTVTDTDEDASENSVSVEFTSSTVRVEFDASFVDGQIVPEVSSTSISSGSAQSGNNQPATAPTTTTAYHDDDDSYEELEDDDSYEEPEDHSTEDAEHDESERDDD